MLKGARFLSKLLKLESLPLETLKTFGHKIDYYFGRIPASLPKLSMHLISVLCFIIVFVKTMVFYLFCCLITFSFSRFLWPYCCDLSHPIKKLTAIAILPMRVVGCMYKVKKGFLNFLYHHSSVLNYQFWPQTFLCSLI